MQKSSRTMTDTRACMKSAAFRAQQPGVHVVNATLMSAGAHKGDVATISKQFSGTFFVR